MPWGSRYSSFAVDNGGHRGAFDGLQNDSLIQFATGPSLQTILSRASRHSPTDYFTIAGSDVKQTFGYYSLFERSRHWVDDASLPGASLYLTAAPGKIHQACADPWPVALVVFLAKADDIAALGHCLDR